MLSGKARLVKVRDDETKRMTDEWVEDVLETQVPDPFDRRSIPIRYSATERAALDDSGEFTLGQHHKTVRDAISERSSHVAKATDETAGQYLWDTMIESPPVVRAERPPARDKSDATADGTRCAPLATMIALRTTRGPAVEFSWRRFAASLAAGCVVGAFLLMMITAVVR